MAGQRSTKHVIALLGLCAGWAAAYLGGAMKASEALRHGSDFVMGNPAWDALWHAALTVGLFAGPYLVLSKRRQR